MCLGAGKKKNYIDIEKKMTFPIRFTSKEILYNCTWKPIFQKFCLRRRKRWASVFLTQFPCKMLALQNNIRTNNFEYSNNSKNLINRIIKLFKIRKLLLVSVKRRQKFQSLLESLPLPFLQYIFENCASEKFGSMPEETTSWLSATGNPAEKLPAETKS